MNYNYSNGGNNPYPQQSRGGGGYDGSSLLNSGMNIVRQGQNISLSRGGYEPQGLDIGNGYQPQGIDLGRGGYQSQGIDMARGMYGSGDANLGRANYANHSTRQNDFDFKQKEFNNNIIAKSNEMKAREENARNIDRMNKLNSEMTRQKYQQHMSQVKDAQIGLAGSKNSNNIYDSLAPQQSNNNNNNNNNNSNKNILIKDYGQRKIHSSSNNNEDYTAPQRNLNSSNQKQQNPPPNPPNFNRFALPQQPQGMQFPNANMGGYIPGMQYPYQFGAPPAFPVIPMPIVYPQSPKASKPMKEISKAIEKQNEVMSSLMNKLNNPNNDATEPKREADDIAKYMQLFNQINNLKQQQPFNPQFNIHQQQPFNNPNNGNNNMMVQLLFQQQMMQVLMHNQAQQQQQRIQEENNKPKKLSSLELLKKMEREEALENAIKQLILAKGGNLQELQDQIDKIMGKSKQPVVVKADSEDDEDDDDEDDSDDEDKVVDKAALEAERRKKIARAGRAKFKKVVHMIMFAKIMITNLKITEDEKRQELIQSVKFMQQLSHKNGLVWAVGACDKAFEVMRKNPKENCDIIHDVDKLKTNVLEERVNSICNLTQLAVEGMFEQLSSMPAEIAKYSAVFYYERSYLPNSIISQFEVDRLQFHETFGYVVNMTNERRIMLVGIQFFVDMIVVIILAKPWEYQMNDKKLASDDLNKQKLITMASIIYHVFFEYLKNSVQPIQNNITKIPEGKKPVHRQNPQLYELGVKKDTDKGTRYNLVTGLIDYNSLLMIWTQKAEWKKQLLEKMKQIIQFIVDKASTINEEAANLERLDNIKNAQEDQLLLPPHIRKTKFDTIVN